jgi:hypothetical protein
MYVSRAIDARGHGIKENPLPLRETPLGRLVYPTPQRVTMDDLLQAAEAVQIPMTEPLLAQFLLASRGGNVVGNNPVFLAAGKSWVGAWTVIRTPIVSGGQPRYRWQGIRVYPTLPAGIRGWVEALPAAARTTGDIDTFASILVQGGWVDSSPGDYATLLRDALLLGR